MGQVVRRIYWFIFSSVFFNLDTYKKPRGSHPTSTDQVLVKGFKRYWSVTRYSLQFSLRREKHLIWAAVNSSTALRQARFYPLFSMPTSSKHKLRKLDWDVHPQQLRKLFTEAILYAIEFLQAFSFPLQVLKQIALQQFWIWAIHSSSCTIFFSAQGDIHRNRHGLKKLTAQK